MKSAPAAAERTTRLSAVRRKQGGKHQMYRNRTLMQPSRSTQLARETQSRVWAYAPYVLFWAAVPATIYIIKERRGMSFLDIWKSVGKLPFA